MTTFPFIHLPDGSFGVAVATWLNERPLELEIVDHESVSWLSSGYSNITSGCCGTGLIVTTAGSSFSFTDCIKSDASDTGFVVQRSVKVVTVSSSESVKGFSTRFSLTPAAAAANSAPNYFMPGILYRNSSAYAPPAALAGDLAARHILVREDRMPLPLVMSHSAESGASAELVHLRPDGASFAGEGGTARIVDGRMLFGSIGIVQTGSRGRALAFQFPGSEGDRTYIRQGAPLPRGEMRHSLVGSTGWANRSHPLQPGFASHCYELRFTVDDAATSYDAALERTWRRAWSEAAPTPPGANRLAVYRASMDLLGVVGTSYHGTPSMPFRIDLASGLVDDDSSQMGFVGKALPAAALLLRDAIETSNATKRQHAIAIVDLWATRALAASPVGVPQTWYNINTSDGSVHFRPSTPTAGHVRVMSEGMAGLLRAYALLGTAAAVEWLETARRYGDFLLSVQNEDGSVPMTWRLNGTSYDPTQLNATDMIVPFLIALYHATNDERYRCAAVRAGEFARTYFERLGLYIGGACDNPNGQRRSSRPQQRPLPAPAHTHARPPTDRLFSSHRPLVRLSASQHQTRRPRCSRCKPSLRCSSSPETRRPGCLRPSARRPTARRGCTGGTCLSIRPTARCTLYSARRSASRSSLSGNRAPTTLWPSPWAPSSGSATSWTTITIASSAPSCRTRPRRCLTGTANWATGNAA